MPEDDYFRPSPVAGCGSFVSNFTADWNSATAALASEEECLRLIDSIFLSRVPHVPLGRGDDCAELEHLPGRLVLSTDMFWQDTHFRTAYFSPKEAGNKALAAAVSDLAAAGAAPLGFSLGLMLPPAPDKAVVRSLLLGMAHMAEHCGLALAGGDLIRGPGYGFSLTVWGGPIAPGAPFLRRGVARPGDCLFLIGQAGLARAGLWALESQGRAARHAWPRACAAHLSPRPLLAQGQILARLEAAWQQQQTEKAMQNGAGERPLHAGHGSQAGPAPDRRKETLPEPGRRLLAGSVAQNVSEALQDNRENFIGLMDLSDGLLRDLPRLLGGLGADLGFGPDLVPAEVEAAAAAQGVSALELFLSGGEDYALLGTCPAAHWRQLRNALPEAALLGHVLQDNGIFYQGRPVTAQGFDHFGGSGRMAEETTRASGNGIPAAPACREEPEAGLRSGQQVCPDAGQEPGQQKRRQTGPARPACASAAATAHCREDAAARKAGESASGQPEHPAAAARTLIRVCREGWRMGLLAGFNGNASCRVTPEAPPAGRPPETDRPDCPGVQPGRQAFLVTASGTAKGRLREEDLCLVPLPSGRLAWPRMVISGDEHRFRPEPDAVSGLPLSACPLSDRCARNGSACEGRRASSESAVHAAIYQACPGTRAVLHTHPPLLLALSLRVTEPGRRLDLPLPEAERYRADLAHTEFYPPGSRELAEAVARAARSCRAVWMERHGLVTHGKSLEEALALSEELEQLASIQLRLLETA